MNSVEILVSFLICTLVAMMLLGFFFAPVWVWALTGLVIGFIHTYLFLKDERRQPDE